VSFKPPSEVQSNAKRGLELRAKYNRGGTEVGVARARDLSNGTSVSLDTIQRMNSYFARHEVDKKGEGWGKDSAGYIAWLLWGGDAGWSWAKGILRDEKKKDKTIMSEFATSYAAIIKQEKQEDGTLKVYGKATDDSLDIDNQICDESWLKRAMPDWFQTGGNVREQHSNIAAGVATDYESKADGHYITALVVDPVSVKKVETGVLKGFSIGIRAPRLIRDEKAVNGRIVDGQIIEVSLVDRPANPNAKLMLAKASQSGELMAVSQTSVPSPADVARLIVKNDDSIEESVTDAPATEEVVADQEVVVEEVAVEPVVDEPVAEPGLSEEDAQAVELINEVKSLLPTLVKYDQATFERARDALSDLIIVEATEQKQGSDERDSIKELLQSIKHLFHWYAGEVAEGEVVSPDPSLVDDDAESIYLSAETDAVCACKCDKCADSKGCDKDECKCDMSKSVTAELNLTTDESVVANIVEKAVAQARTAVTEEIASLQSALKAEQEKAIQLQGDLETAQKAVVAGGPKRSTITTKSNDSSQLLIKSAEYLTKAKNTADSVLAQGYRDLAKDLRKQAEKGN
jgi:hypothetical protein